MCTPANWEGTRVTVDGRYVETWGGVPPSKSDRMLVIGLPPKWRVVKANLMVCVEALTEERSRERWWIAMLKETKDK